MMYYRLEDKKIIPCDLMTWAAWLEKPNRLIRRDNVGDIFVSTVFLGIDHSFGGPEPLLFETLVFGGPLDSKMDRYSTYDEAVAGHIKMLHKVRQATPRERGNDKMMISDAIREVRLATKLFPCLAVFELVLALTGSSRFVFWFLLCVSLFHFCLSVLYWKLNRQIKKYRTI